MSDKKYSLFVKEKIEPVEQIEKFWTRECKNFSYILFLFFS